MNKPRIAFLGLGLMGTGMARRLLGNGFPLTVYNRNPEKAKSLVIDGARLATSPRAAASEADVILTMVADDNASRNVWLGDKGALAAARQGLIAIECSTVTVDWVRELATFAASKQCEFLDAPVTGSKMQAAAGELNFIVGGSTATLEKARPVLSVMSKTILAAGPIGSGALLKLINNFLCGTQVVALAEAMAMIERSTLDRATAVEFLVNGAPASPLVKTVSARMTAPDFTPNFMMRHLAKDLNYAIKEAGKYSLDLATAVTALDLLQKGVAAGYGDKDMAAAVELFRNNQPKEKV